MSKLKRTLLLMLVVCVFLTGCLFKPNEDLLNQLSVNMFKVGFSAGKYDIPKEEAPKVDPNTDKRIYKIDFYLEKAKDKFVLDLIGNKITEIYDIYYLGNIKTQIYKILK